MAVFISTARAFILPRASRNVVHTAMSSPSSLRIRSVTMSSVAEQGSEQTKEVDILTAELKSDFLKTMRDRGFFHQCTDLEGLDKKMSEEGPLKAYLGFDATADSLHVGSLLQILILRNLQRAGHKPIVLVGGGTTKVGDPSGKDEARKLLTEADIQRNIDGISGVFRKFLAFGDGPTDALLVNNDEWLSELNYLQFLRDYGPHFTINRMLNFESVRLRLEREQPLSFLEFNYMILQGYDFLELSRRYDVALQLGGSDQWGNIINGIDLARKLDQKQVFGLTAPLITTSDGKKMGKSAAGAVWLNADKLPAYDYWQFWRNTADEDVVRFMKLFTELPLEQIEGYAALTGAAINDAKVVLADEATRMLHGEACLGPIKEAAAALFAGGGGQGGGGGGAADSGALPTVALAPGELGEEGATGGVPAVDLYLKLGFAKSKAEARRLIKGGGARLNDVKIEDENYVVGAGDFTDGRLKLSSGKKKHGIVELQQ
eukprot:CAMPEP_0194710326 /NCGR_PEP_ID=MMETSP0296-20130528/2927_1 /TAXON_ID=39354 /ORGANISM="Heterosigma akashiwo, Strain CCMP2393" /LENGTH=488 /DNA_ID=CAMNT_0039607975 /DNA_START=109 /DNA_END=1578 /DNA_ORIENTATION=+